MQTLVRMARPEGEVFRAVGRQAACSCTHAHTNTHTNIHVHTHAHICTHTYACTHTPAYTYMQTHTHACTHICTHTCAHTAHTHTYTCTHARTRYLATQQGLAGRSEGTGFHPTWTSLPQPWIVALTTHNQRCASHSSLDGAHAGHIGKVRRR